MRSLQWMFALAGPPMLLVGIGGSAQAAALGHAHRSVPNPLITAYRQTTAAKSAKVQIRETVTAHAKGSTTRASITATGTTSLAQSNPDGSLAMTIPSDGTVDVRVVGGMVYLKLPPKLRQHLGTNKPWISLNVSKLANATLGESYSELTSSSETSQQTLSYLEATSASGVKKLGTAKIGGITTTRYHAVIELKKLPSVNPGLAPIAKRLEQEFGVSSIPTTVWLDGQHRVRQITIDETGHTSGSGSSGGSGTSASASVSTTIDYSHFGTSLSVKAPPSADVYNATNKVLGASSTSSHG